MSPVVGLVPLLGLLWGLNWPVVRVCLDEMSPWTLRAAAFGLAAPILFGVLVMTRQSPVVPRKHWLRLFVAGMLTVVFYNLLSAFAQLTATTSRAAVLSYTMPIWTVLLATIFLGEPLDRRRKLGLLLGASGLLALGWPIVAAGQLSWGLLFAIGSGVSWAFGNIFLKRFPIQAPPLVVTAWHLSLGAAVTACGMLLVEGVPTPHMLGPVTLAAFAYHVLLGQAAATVIWYTMLTHLPGGVAAIGSLLVPGVGVVSATLLLGERPTPTDWIGLVLIVAASASVLVRAAPQPQGRS